MALRFQIELEIGYVGFEERENPEKPEKSLSEQGREPTTNSTHDAESSPGIESGPHWWEASALITVPSLLPPVSSAGPS